MTSILGHRIALLGVIAGGLLGNAAGCGASAASVCDAICDCTECNNQDYEDCVDDTDDVFQKADRAGCADKADAYVQCVDSSLQCVDGKVEVASCDAESDDLSACAGSVPSFAGSCEAGAKKLQECLGATINPSDIANCTGSIQCTLRCYAAATCDDLRSGSSMVLNACLSMCPVQPVPGGGGFDGGTSAQVGAGGSFGIPPGSGGGIP